MSVNGGLEAKKRKISAVDGEDDSLLAGSSKARSATKTISTDWLSSSQKHLRSRDLTGQLNGKPVNVIEFSDDGSWFVSGGDDGRMLLWPTIKALDEKWTPKATEIKDPKYDYAIFCLAVSPDNGRIFSAGGCGKLLINDVTT